MESKDIEALGADVIVVATGAGTRQVGWRGNQVVNALIPAILAMSAELHTAGDCVAPRTADIAIAEGAMVARQI